MTLTKGMSFWTRLFGTAKPERRAITYQIGTLNGLVDAATRSGVHVNETTALALSALWCGIKVISQDVGSLEPVLYRETPDGLREPATDHPLYTVLTEVPNADMTRPVAWETMQSHALLFGNAFAELERDGTGNVLALWPIHPGNMTVGRDAGGRLVYTVKVDQGQVTIDAADILHVPGLSPDGSVGYKLLQVARETLGFGLAAQRFGEAFFGNAARPGGVLQTQGQLSDPARENLRKSWATLHSGPENAGKIAILEEGLTFMPLTQTNEQSQYVEVLRWHLYEVARFLNIPPSKLHSLEKATWGNLETLNQDYLTTTLRPWLVKWEHELERKCLRPDERRTHYIEFDTSLMLRADIGTRYAAYSTALTSGFLTVDEVRAKENLPPLPKAETAPSAPASVATLNLTKTEEAPSGNPLPLN